MGLDPLPESFATTRLALHRLAAEVVAPARKPDNEIALGPAPDGFGTPEFEFDGSPQRVRVEGAELVRDVAGQAQRAPLSSLAAAGVLVADLLPDGGAVRRRSPGAAGPSCRPGSGGCRAARADPRSGAG